ncbi:hypothetical protein LEN26_016698 [Aphanomyces euteiches]|nr:hypothetical protein LEN26_016698 [Aphanomyces euteiches]KAH9105150.1 hypothetical protein AeMF1_018950 [Aphanomyces euteiches]
MKLAGRHILLLLDNVSSHKCPQSLSNITIEMLPPNTMPHLQSQDAGVIMSFKAKIAQLKTQNAVEKFDELLRREVEIGEAGMKIAMEKLHHVDILTAMEWANVAWQHVTDRTISNCWTHTQIDFPPRISILLSNTHKTCLWHDYGHLKLVVTKAGGDAVRQFLLRLFLTRRTSPSMHILCLSEWLQHVYVINQILPYALNWTLNASQCVEILFKRLILRNPSFGSTEEMFVREQVPEM